MEGGLHGNSGGYGGAGEGEGGTGGYVEQIKEYLGDQLSLKEIYNKDLTEVEIEKIKAEAELERSKTDFLKEQMAMPTDPKMLDLTQMMPTAGGGMDFTTLAIIGVAVWYFSKGGK